MRTKFLAFFASVAVFVSCEGQAPNKVKTVAPADFAQKIKDNPNAQILDVRTADEFSGGHLDHAQNIDWYEKEAFEKKIAALDKSKPVFVYCMAGSRSHRAAEKLHNMGFSQVYDLEGGIVKWNAAGLSGEKEPEKIIGMCSQEYGDLIKSDQKVLVDFYASWCEPCRKMAPYLEKMAAENKDVKIVKLNADEHKTLMKEMKIEVLPTLFLYVDGKQTWTHSGFISEDDLKKQLK